MFFGWRVGGKREDFIQDTDSRHATNQMGDILFDILCDRIDLIREELMKLEDFLDMDMENHDPGLNLETYQRFDNFLEKIHVGLYIMQTIYICNL